MAGDFADFDIEDFAFEESFQHWVLKTNPEHEEFWGQYLAEHPEQTDKILAARVLVLDLHTDDRNTQDDLLAQEIWEQVDHRTRPTGFVIWRRMKAWHVAASFLMLAVGLGVWLWKSEKAREVAAVPMGVPLVGRMREELNATGSVRQITLPDGSVVSLDPDSKLVYPARFEGRERVVQLSGEAFFEVKRDTERPFLIYANETVTKVLGTSFRIKAYVSAPQVIVSVVTGKVSVFGKQDYEENQNNARLTGLILTANQQAEFSRQELHFNKTLVEKPLIVESAPRTSFDFDNTPLQDVFKILQDAYGVEIIFDPELVNGRSLQVSLEDESLYEKLDVICKTMGMSYQIVDARILIGKQDGPKSLSP
ncbi:FecR family protein [Dyadobacter sp. CY261]|uniref:FecR family protein n=1 Tax=Dyadobacter sp. CY261 TaxID=2907203 RepID=UPI001F3D56AE|nr:FecR family protein [Dyadobacter sp. CY261]MCF0074059.1 FecR family protein [Dyadobacter sp. CY261]